MLAIAAPAQQQKVINFQTSPALDDADVRKLVEKYRTMDVASLKAQFAAVEPDTSIETAVAGLPDQWKSISRTAAQVGDARLWRVGEKAMKITGSRKYEFIYLANSAPLAVSDSNCVLVVTSAMLQLTDGNDDALLGVIIHETAHGMFAVRSVQIKKDFNAAIKVKDWAKADELRKELALLELECDLIAGKMLQESKYKVPRYADLQIRLEQIEAELKIPRSVQWHPLGEIRKKALLSLVNNKESIAKN